MCYEQINRDQFQRIMEQLTGESIWLKVHTDVLTVDINYPEFEFLSFLNGNYQFGHMTHQEEHELQYQDLLIDKNDIDLIHRCSMSPTVNAEQIILTLANDVKIFLETENC